MHDVAFCVFSYFCNIYICRLRCICSTCCCITWNMCFCFSKWSGHNSEDSTRNSVSFRWCSWYV